MVVLHLVEHRSDRGHHLLQDQVPLIVLKMTQIEEVQIKHTICSANIFTICNTATLLIATYWR
jgi:pyridoxine 5'-phosphate synthase PdxJ